MDTKKIHVATGFVTGRKTFKDVIKTYANSWNDNDLNVLEGTNKYHLNLFIAYDLKYSNTLISDYKRIAPEIYNCLESVNYLDANNISNEINSLVTNNIITRTEANLLFGNGYAKKRNIILYFALKYKMDYLLFIDDDEYPLATFKTSNGNINWSGQNVIETHLKYIVKADITHGHHCGYVSPIPYLKFNCTLTENDFKTFIEMISNDIINWDSIKSKMKDGGITYANESILNNSLVKEVSEVNGGKYISGSNLCFNLKHMNKIPPFYNPPQARGEDTFLSTCLSDAKVLKIPCYTFHDGFMMYPHLLHGVLPNKLKPVTANSKRIILRFIKANVGWIRYKPLLLYITKPDTYNEEILVMKENIKRITPKLCRYFNNDGFTRIYQELEKYDHNVVRHYDLFMKTKEAWEKVVNYLRQY
ncbi:MAG: hypothetical protein PHD60_06595 [Clostridia bacterium]|nr:hypothetical protein [Clostridia bacterium]